MAVALHIFSLACFRIFIVWSGGFGLCGSSWVRAVMLALCLCLYGAHNVQVTVEIGGAIGSELSVDLFTDWSP